MVYWFPISFTHNIYLFYKYIKIVKLIQDLKNMTPSRAITVGGCTEGKMPHPERCRPGCKYDWRFAWGTIVARRKQESQDDCLTLVKKKEE